MHKSIVCTVGHSNRSIEDFIGMLWVNEVAKVIDVRTIPRPTDFRFIPTEITDAGDAISTDLVHAAVRMVQPTLLVLELPLALEAS